MDKVVELRDRGLSFVVATHDPVVMKVADVILHLRHGAMEAETSEDRLLSVIDAFGRIQLPPAALRMFPDRRAVVSFDEAEVRITPP
jgi:ABC-type protease/lipase transport system fused ATPase/permease subunit